MASATKKLLSGSTNGKQILIVHTTNGTADTIHTAVAGTSSVDEVWLYAYNDSTTAAVLNILWGGVTEPDNVIRLNLAPQSGRTIISDGMLLQNGLVIKAYANVASKVTVDGFVNNIS
jgi:hypothetical protein